MAVRLEGIRVHRGGRLVLDIPSLRLESGQVVAILGANGAGKTTLLRLIAGLERPSTGAVDVAGASVRPDQIAYVFQEHVFLRRSVRENLELGLRLRGLGKAARQDRVEAALNLLGIAHLSDRRADRLSGGEARRASLARALCLHAPIVLLDEPLAGLDERTYMRLLDDLPQLLAAFDATTLLVTHDRHEAIRLAQHLVVLVDGRVLAAGDKRDVVANLRCAEVAQVLGYAVVEVNGRHLAVPPGAVKLGRGSIECTMIVDGVVDLIDSRQILGRIGETSVRVESLGRRDSVRRGDHVCVHIDKALEVSKDAGGTGNTPTPSH